MSKPSEFAMACTARRPTIGTAELQSNQYSGASAALDSGVEYRCKHRRKRTLKSRETSMNFGCLLRAALLLLALAAAGQSGAADELAEVNRLHRAGQLQTALEHADRVLASSPRDPQMRFAKAAILADLRHEPEAIGILETLTEDHPDLAEPYNNLAVLYAASGRYSMARAALEQALRLNPTYATAHENLGDVQAALAAQSYTAALRLDPSRTGIAAKLDIVRGLAAPKNASTPASAVAETGSR